MPIGAKACRQAAGDAPQVRQFKARESFALRRFVEKTTDAGGCGVFFREAVRDLRERLRRRDPDRDRNSGPLQHRAPQLARMRLTPRLEAGEAEKSFVDRVDFKVRGEVGEDAHHAAAHVAIELVIA